MYHDDPFFGPGGVGVRTVVLLVGENGGFGVKKVFSCLPSLCTGLDWSEVSS